MNIHQKKSSVAALAFAALAVSPFAAHAATTYAFSSGHGCVAVFAAMPVLPKVSPGPDAARVAEIAAHLPERPGWTEKYTPPNPGRARAYLKRAIPECPDELYLRFRKDGNRTEYQKPYGQRLDMLRHLAAMAEKEGGEYLAKTEELLRAICAERSWVMPAHDRSLGNFNGTSLTIDLGSSHRAYAIAEVLTRLDNPPSPSSGAVNRLSQETRALAMREMERRIFSLYRATNRDSKDPKKLHGNWWFYVRSNWNAVCHANVVRSALALIEDRQDRAAFVEASERGMRYFLESFLEDGYCTEGGGYWNYGFGHFLHLAKVVKGATDGFVDLTRLPRAKEAMEYGFGYRLARNKCPVFADGGGSAPSFDFLKLGVEFWPEMKPLVEGNLPQRTAFPAAQVYIMRGKRVAFGVKGGNNAELHNHNDVGSWTITLDGTEMAGDPGGEIYTARTFSPKRYESDVLNSYGHPVPLVDGAKQGAGAKFAAKVLSSEFTDACDTVTYDIKGAYPATTNALSSLVREVSLDRGAECVTLRDTFAFVTPGSFESPIVTYAKVEKGADGRSFTLAAGKTRMKVTFEVKGGEWDLVEQSLENPGRPSPLRMAVRFRAPVKEGSVEWRLSPEGKK